MSPIEKIIYEHPFLEEMDPKFLPHWVEAASLVRADAQQPIFHQGQEADAFYLIEKGRVALESRVAGRRVVKIQAVRGGDALGWSWLFPPYLWHFSARALTETEMVSLNARTLRQCARAHPDFGYDLAMRVAGVMLQRLQATRLKLLELAPEAHAEDEDSGPCQTTAG